MMVVVPSGPLLEEIELLVLLPLLSVTELPLVVVVEELVPDRLVVVTPFMVVDDVTPSGPAFTDEVAPLPRSSTTVQVSPLSALISLAAVMPAERARAAAAAKQI